MRQFTYNLIHGKPYNLPTTTPDVIIICTAQLDPSPIRAQARPSPSPCDWLPALARPVTSAQPAPPPRGPPGGPQGAPRGQRVNPGGGGGPWLALAGLWARPRSDPSPTHDVIGPTQARSMTSRAGF